MTHWWQNEFYSQFGEDGVLAAYYRAKGYARSASLDDFGTGFYVDIGAHHPFMLSNTWFFYQRGWRGITVEPTPGTKDLFDELRPRDINLQLAIADRDGTASFHIHPHGVENSLDGERAATGGNAKQITVATRTLASMLDQHLPAGVAIDILSVDVEGLDETVLRSNDWGRYRPELIIAEHHSSDIGLVLNSSIYGYMIEQGYKLYGWTQPSLLFYRC